MAHIPYGTFNPRFYGISMVNGDPQQFDIWDRYHESEVKDWAKGTDTDDLGAISTLSAPDHETRHFHDFLVSTVGTTTMGLRMQASINGIQVMKEISRCFGAYVPLPLMQWLAWNRGERERWIQSTGKYYGVSRLEDVVSLPEPEALDDRGLTPGLFKVDQDAKPESLVERYAVGAVAAYRTMDEMKQPRDWGLDVEMAADDVFEASAHLIQNQAIWTGQGQAAAMLYHNFLMTARVTYLRPLQILMTALKQSGQVPSLQRLVELFAWMMMGPYKDPRGSGNPAFRLTQVLAIAVASPGRLLARPNGEPADLWDDLDKFTKSSSWRENLQTAQLAADRRNQFYLDANKQLRGGFFDALFSVAKGWHADQQMARDRLHQDPASYVNPLRYISENAFPRPNFEIRFGSHIHERDEVLAVPGSRAVTADDEGKKVLSYIACTDKTKDPEYVDHLRDSRIVSHLIDYLFLDEPAVTLYEQYWRLRLERIMEKKVISVF